MDLYFAYLDRIRYHFHSNFNALVFYSYCKIKSNFILLKYLKGKFSIIVLYYPLFFNIIKKIKYLFTLQILLYFSLNKMSMYLH